MNLPLQLLRRVQGRAGQTLAITIGAVAAVVVLVAAVAALARSIEPGLIGDIADRAVASPLDVLIAATAFLGAFALRASLWVRVATGLSYGQSLAGIMVATGANHVLPFRLGEPFRVVSVVRRAGMRADDAAASTVALRVGDVLALLLIGVVLGPAVVTESLGWWGVLVVVALLMLAAAAMVSMRRAQRAGRLQPPDLITVIGTIGAWFLEAVLVWRVATWAGVELAYLDAVVVGAVAVAAQLVAVAPGGVGTYEAAAVIALTAAGIPAGEAVAVAVAVHVAKSALTIGGGIIAFFVPSPGMLGRLRVPASAPPRPTDTGPVPEPDDGRPVVLFLPAYNEGPRITGVIERVPDRVLGHRVEVVVVDDGSSDDTADRARRAGATVVSHAPNRGLGAAVATGLRVGVERDAVVVAFCDADGEYDPAELESLVTPILSDRADYVVGSRFAGEIEHMRPHRRFGNKVLTVWVRWMSRAPVTDGQSGYRALSHAAAAETVLAHDYNYAQVLTLDLVMRGFRYDEVPIRYRFRESGRSFVRLGRYLRRCVPAAWCVVNGRVSPPEPAGTAPSTSPA